MIKMATPQLVGLPASLTGKIKGSFAYNTIKDRLPLILTRVVDTLHRHKHEFFEEHGEKGIEAEKKAIAYLSKLRNELQTDKPLIALNDNLPDTPLWNQYLEYHKNVSNEPPSWFQSPWLYTECYMYRRIHEALIQRLVKLSKFDVVSLLSEMSLRVPLNPHPIMVSLSMDSNSPSFIEAELEKDFVRKLACSKLQYHSGLHVNPPISNYDVFKEEKNHAFFESQQAIIVLSSCLQEMLKNTDGLDEKCLKEEFCNLIQVSLWGNKCDLSISAGADNSQKSDPLQSVEEFKKFILVDHMEKLWSLLINKKKNKTPTRLDIVLDNTGFELITDLVLADFLISSELVTEIHFHGKSIPWYVSDTTKHDLDWTIGQMKAANHKWMARCGVSWEGYLKKGVWIYHDHMFWTLPHEFSSMAQIAPDLYTELQKSSLIIFKGDLNYRKLTGDRKWEFTVPFHQALNNFQPAPLCSLRTLKSDTQVGLKPGLGEQLMNTDPEWMISGKYGIIQFDATS